MIGWGIFWKNHPTQGLWISMLMNTCLAVELGQLENRDGTRKPGGIYSSPRLIDRMSDATVMLAAVEAGAPQAAEQLLALVYDELRRLAASKLALEAPGQTLQPTALVH